MTLLAFQLVLPKYSVRFKLQSNGRHEVKLNYSCNHRISRVK